MMPRTILGTMQESALSLFFSYFYYPIFPFILSLSFLLHDLGSNICYICIKNRKKVVNSVLNDHQNFLVPRFTVDNDFYQFYVYKIESS